jgi:hypothetical protein
MGIDSLIPNHQIKSTATKTTKEEIELIEKEAELEKLEREKQLIE